MGFFNGTSRNPLNFYSVTRCNVNINAKVLRVHILILYQILTIKSLKRLVLYLGGLRQICLVILKGQSVYMYLQRNRIAPPLCLQGSGHNSWGNHRTFALTYAIHSKQIDKKTHHKKLRISPKQSSWNYQGVLEFIVLYIVYYSTYYKN